MTIKELTAKSFRLRKDAAEIIYNAKRGHLGGDFSVMDILVTLYYKHMNVSPYKMEDHERDRFILSKGHSVEALYSVLCDRGFFTREELNTFSRFGSEYIGHPNNKINGIEINSGSLGHGLSVGVGMAFAGKMDNAPYKVYVVMGDGELAEGSVWEGAMAAGHYRLDNIIAVIDRNELQISGPTEKVMSLENLRRRWESFGWNVIETAGNDIAALDAAVSFAKSREEMPTVIIAKTVKGYGFSQAENRAEWHHKIPTATQYASIIQELEKYEREALL